MSDLNVVDVLVLAEFQESIRTAIPQIIGFLRHNEWTVHLAGVAALSRLSKQGKVSNFLTVHC